MKTGDASMSVYLLIDNGLLHEASASYTETESSSRPAWLAPIYTERALSVSPFLVDLEAAYEAGDLDQVMNYLNALKPALHVSIIETELGFEQIAQHLRRFIFIVDPEGKQFTFRYADCTVLALLPAVLTAGQWGTMAGPIKRWGVHDRSRAVFQLPSTNSDGGEPIPFRLGSAQIATLDEASEPDHYIAKIKMMGNQDHFPGTRAEQYTWAKSARQYWRASDNKKTTVLMFLTEAAIKTRGKILHHDKTERLLLIDEIEAFLTELTHLSEEILE